LVVRDWKERAQDGFWQLVQDPLVPQKDRLDLVEIVFDSRKTLVRSRDVSEKGGVTRDSD
jgi:hypothetical protein